VASVVISLAGPEGIYRTGRRSEVGLGATQSTHVAFHRLVDAGFSRVLCPSLMSPGGLRIALWHWKNRPHEATNQPQDSPIGRRKHGAQVRASGDRGLSPRLLRLSGWGLSRTGCRRTHALGVGAESQKRAKGVVTAQPKARLGKHVLVQRRAFQGSMTGTPAALKALASRVATAKPWAVAMAAM